MKHGLTTAMGFTVQEGMVLGAVASNGTLTDFFVEQEIPSGLGKVGNLYKGRVTQVVPTLQAVFVDIGLLRHGFLSMNDVVYDAVERFRGSKRGRRKVEDVFRAGDPVLVQIEKESRGDKGATVTTKISIPGRYVVYMPYGRENHISRQVQGETERNRLRQITDEIELPQGGLILRTAAKDKGKRELAADIDATRLDDELLADVTPEVPTRRNQRRRNELRADLGLIEFV